MLQEIVREERALKPSERGADRFTVGAFASRALLRSSRAWQTTADHAAAMGGALVCVLILGWLGLTGFAWTDYDLEAANAFWALRTGDFETFFSMVPAYGGSFVLRAPFAWLTALWDGGELAVYRAVSLPGMLACAALGVAVVERMRALGRSRLDRAVVLIALVASPVAFRALEIGHPEELLGGALCVAAVLLAPTRPVAAGVLVGLAVANKPWALVAVPVVVAAVPASRAVRAGIAAGAVALLVVSPLLLFGGGFAQNTMAASSTTDIFQPWQVWWFLGEGGRLHEQLGAGVRVLRHPPEWLMALTRPIILAVPVALAAVWWRVRRTGGAADAGAALLLLALVLHLRCLLDPWNIGYYGLPTLLALAAWEGLHRRDRPPVLTLAFVAANWLTFETLFTRVGADVQSLVYLSWGLPLAAWMAWRVFGSAIRPVGVRTSNPV